MSYLSFSLKFDADKSRMPVNVTVERKGAGTVTTVTYVPKEPPIPVFRVGQVVRGVRPNTMFNGVYGIVVHVNPIKVRHPNTNNVDSTYSGGNIDEWLEIVHEPKEG